MIVGAIGAVYLVESTDVESMVLTMYVAESTAVVNGVIFVIHPFL